VVEYLDIGSLYEDNIDETCKKAQLIDKWIRQEMIDRGFPLVVVNYKKILARIEKVLDLDPSQSGYKKLNKIYLYFYLNLPKAE